MPGEIRTVIGLTALAVVVALATLPGLAGRSQASSILSPERGPVGPDSYKFWGIPRTFVEVQRGEFGDTRWTLRMRGRHRHRCYALAAANALGVLGGQVCGDPDRHPIDDWGQALGAGSGGARGGSVELQITSQRVRRLNVLIGPRSSHPLRWIRTKTRALTRNQASRAHLHRNFRYSVVHSRGRLCIRRVVAFDASGAVIGRFKSPCEL
jgi:hypothetical protein